MKKLLIVLSALMFCTSSFGQGQFVFLNRLPNVFYAPITIEGSGAPAGSIPGLIAELYLVSGGGEGVSPGVIGTSTFRTPEAQQAYFYPTTVTVDGYTDISQGFLVLQVRVRQGFDGSILGASAPFEARPGVAPSTPTNIQNLQAFTIPEPVTMVLGLLGGAVLLHRRRN